MRTAIVPTLLALVGVATAEEALDPQADQLPLITITATKVAADPVSVPASVAVVTGSTVIEAGHTTIDDIAASTAGMSYSKLGTHTTYPVIRGMFGLTVDSPTGYYIDGVAQTGLGADQLVDVDRVEILRGPQGTLYGRNSIPGIINVITRDPGREWTGYGILDGAERRSFSATAAAGGPLGQGFGLRLAVRGARSDSPISNQAPQGPEPDSNRDLTVQGKLRWVSKDEFTSISLSSVTNRFAASGDHFAPIDDALRHRTNNDHEGAFNRSLESNSLTITQQLAQDIQLTSVTGFNHHDDLFDIDEDFSAIDGITFYRRTRESSTSEELRLTGGSGLRSWVLGLYGNFSQRNVAGDTVAKPPFSAPAPFEVDSHSDYQEHKRNFALFGQAGIPLGEQLTLTLGLRGDLEFQRATLNQRAVAPALGGAQVAGFDFSDEQRFHAMLPKASLSWSWSKSSFTYATVSRGYRSGGYNDSAQFEQDIDGGFDPEYATVTELGHRAVLFDRRLSISGAIYHTAYTNKQFVILDAPHYYFVNAAEADINGAELEIEGRLGSGIQVFANGSAISSRIKSYDGPSTGTAGNPLPDLEGNRLPLSSDFTATLGLQWRHTSGLFIRPEVNFVGRYANDIENNIMQDPYQLIGLRLGYEWDRAGVYVWGKNLGQARYLTNGSTTSFKNTPEEFVGVAADPRTVGASAQIEF